MNDAYAQRLLRELAMKGAIKGYVVVSTTDLGKRLGISQQSASRWLSELAEMGLIRKDRFGKNVKVKITPEGENILKRAWFEYLLIFGEPKVMTLKGTVMSGLGEGRYYVMREGYRRQIREKLFFDPYPGTLNVKVYPIHKKSIKELREEDCIILKGFSEGERTFGRVRAYHATLNGYPGALIIPEMSHYRDVIEMIADIGFREKFGIRDGDEVEIKVYL